MPEQLTEQERLFGQREVSYGTVTVSNADLFPFFRLTGAVVSECRLRYDGDTFQVRAADPSNVAMGDVTLDVDTDLQTEFTIGLNNEHVGNLLQNKPRGDDAVDVTLDLNRPHSTLSVESEYANGRVWNLTERFGLLDPDSIRQEPDLPNVEFDCRADLPVPTVSSYATSRDSTNPIRFEASGGGFRLAQLNDDTDHDAEYDSMMETTDVDVEGVGSSMYGHYWVKKMFSALNAVGVDTATVEWTDDYPMMVSFDGGSVSGYYMLAPRIKA